MIGRQFDDRAQEVRELKNEAADILKSLEQFENQDSDSERSSIYSKGSRKNKAEPLAIKEEQQLSRIPSSETKLKKQKR